MVDTNLDFRDFGNDVAVRSVSEGVAKIERFLSVGTLEYSPPSLGTSPSKWWLILRCDPCLGQYYRHLYWIGNHRTRKLLRPVWAEHVTVIRNEEPPLQNLWQKHAGLPVEFWYNPLPRSNGTYWWVDVECPLLDEIREELGLSSPEIPFHMSFGHEG